MNKFYGDKPKNKHLDEIIYSYFPENYKGVFLDIGAYDPIIISNSYYFELNKWDTYCFEANPNLIPNLKMHRKNVFNCAVSNEDKEDIDFNIVYQNLNNDDWNKTASFSSIDLNYFKLPVFQEFINKKEYKIEKIKIKQRSLNSILQNELNFIDKIDVIDIDIEGNELDCLKGIDLHKYMPKVLLIENMNNNHIFHTTGAGRLERIIISKICKSEIYITRVIKY